MSGCDLIILLFIFPSLSSHFFSSVFSSPSSSVFSSPSSLLFTVAAVISSLLLATVGPPAHRLASLQPSSLLPPSPSPPSRPYHDTATIALFTTVMPPTTATSARQSPCHW
ncbi:hypothetical protein RIF29_14750 [Crotalaria pallida]|uniref:Uncharacterized protein n=1 Tax=Crotalaria pallida TaxID=3830 RepID=A0AAN9FG01_CROPI